MIQPGTQFGKRGRVTTRNSSEESKWLELIVMAMNNEGGQLSAILAALGGSPTPYNTVGQAIMATGDSPVTYTGGSIHSISFQVINGTMDVSMDGGGTSVTYPAGSNVNLQADTLFNTDIIFTIPGTSTNRTLIQTTAI
jgi:hypothetical protein